MKTRYLALTLILFTLSVTHAQAPVSFSAAKKRAALIFTAHPYTLYCHCTYNRKQTDLISCHMQDAQEKSRAQRIEWDHLFSAEQFGQHFNCWREPLCTDTKGQPYKGRRCCEKIEPRFRQMEAELYNLWPVVGLVNQARSNYRFAQLTTHKSYYGCEFTVVSQARQVEPADWTKGIVARAHLFMSDHYNIPLSPAQRSLFLAWHKQFPADNWEKHWAQEVALIEGYDNPYIH